MTVSLRKLGFSLSVALISTAAFAQDADAGLTPKAANPGDGAAPVIRELPADATLDEDGGTPAPLQVDLPPAATTAAGKNDEKKEEKKDDSSWNLTAALAASARINYGGSTLFPLAAALISTPLPTCKQRRALVRARPTRRAPYRISLGSARCIVC
jgi:hypothetical protein